MAYSAYRATTEYARLATGAHERLLTNTTANLPESDYLGTLAKEQS